MVETDAVVDDVCWRLPATYEPQYLEVGVVGQGAMEAHSKVTHHIACPTIGGPPVAGTFTAPEIESDKVPAPLGLKVLTRMQSIMDIGTNCRAASLDDDRRTRSSRCSAA